MIVKFSFAISSCRFFR